jgi:nicotinic acid mononucleotide adenylyltransferase
MEKNMDRYYSNLLERTDMETVIGAGWFDAKLTEPLEEDLRFYTTALEQITRSNEKEVAVLYYMGCFAPVHEGHITVMKLAKEAVEAQTSLPVVAGYFAPDHDSYVGTKTDDPAYKAAERVAYIQNHPEVEDWMQVDVWPALYAPTDLNFTTIYDRFNRYMKKWLPLDVKVRLYCVFGGDNYLFANTFTEYGHAVCVPRQGAAMDKTLLLPNDRVLWSEKGSSDLSSTKVRAMLAAENAKNETDEKFYVLRDDLELAFPKTPNTITGKLIAQALEILLTSHTGKHVQVVDVMEQVQKFESDKPFISLDCFLETEHKLELTRVFKASDTQTYSKLHTNRTGTAPIEEQVLTIPKGTYDLVDDDIATGATMNTVATLLNQHGINVGEFRCLLESYGEDIYDVLDMRDFVLGARNGGLTIKTINGETTRAMYAAPYVNLVTRAKMNAVKAISFSLEVWKMNHSIYRGSNLTVGDISDCQDYSLFGFSKGTLVEDLCAHHIGLLSKVLK